MGLFDFITSIANVGPGQQIVQRYQRLGARLRLNDLLVEQLTGDMITEGAKKLGMLRGGRSVELQNEIEMSVLMDYCIYEVYRNGRNLVEQYLCDASLDPESDDAVFLRAMQHATYTLIAVQNVQRGVGCQVLNLFTEETQQLIDLGFSQTARPGTTLATRLLDFGDFVTTGGAALPVGIFSNDELDDWRKLLSSAITVGRVNPAPLICACLNGGASSQIRYAGPDEDELDGIGLNDGFAPTPAPVQRGRRPAARRPAGKPATNRRCRCGSGKMYKNCCGKR